MKKSLFICGLVLMLSVLQLFSAKAALVSIPDANFRTYLKTSYPTCFVGDLMETTCSRIVNEYWLTVNNKNISNLDGIQYFSNLGYLECAVNNLTSLPTLPNNLEGLDCSVNQLTTLPDLPVTLLSLECSRNKLTSLPTLPSNIIILKCDLNKLTSLPSLPNTLTDIWCNVNQLTSLPILPSNLLNLLCTGNKLSSLPELPPSLIYLSCFGNQLTNLPQLPNSLEGLECYSNQLTSLPTIPPRLTILACYFNLLTSLPDLPASIQQLECYNNQLTSLPTLPSNLVSLNCFYNQLVSLPSLPAGLKQLNCSNNQLVSLPVLPSGLNTLFAFSNKLTSLPSLPLSLTTVHCHNNCFVSVPINPYPSTLTSFSVTPNRPDCTSLSNSEINISQSSTSIQSNGIFNFGTLNIAASSSAIVFTIENTGSGNLLLTGNPKINLTGANASDFTIDESATLNSISPGGSTTFTIHFTPSSYCNRNASISIANNDSNENPYIINLLGSGALPLITISGNTSVCSTASGIIYSVPNNSTSTYTWTLPSGYTLESGQGTNSISVTIGSEAGNISVVETTSNGCTANSEPFTITPTTPTPLFAFGTTTNLCSGTTAPVLPTISANGIQGNWSPAVVSNTSSDVYTFTPTGCGSPVTYTVTILPATTPVFAFGTTTNLCSGTTAPVLPTISANGIQGNWSPAVVSNTSSGVYTFTPTECGSTVIFTVTVIPQPSAPAVTSPITYCRGTVASALTASGTNLQWYTTVSGGVGSTTAPIPNTASAGSTSYYVSQTSTGCESLRAAITVNVNSVPAAPIVSTPVNLVVNGPSSILTATGNNLKWYTTATGGVGSTTAPVPSTTVAGTTTFYVSQTTNGCESNRAAIVVNVNAGNIIVASCFAKNSTYTAQLNPMYTTNATSYSWWVNGYTQSISPMNNPVTSISTGNWFTGGQLCVGINYNQAPWYRNFCVNVSLCPNSVREASDAFESTSETELLVQVYPNPSVQDITIETTSLITNVELKNTLGMTLQTFKEINGKQIIPWDKQASAGVYILTYTTVDGKHHKQVLLKH